MGDIYIYIYTYAENKFLINFLSSQTSYITAFQFPFQLSKNSLLIGKLLNSRRTGLGQFSETSEKLYLNKPEIHPVLFVTEQTEHSKTYGHSDRSLCFE